MGNCCCDRKDDRLFPQAVICKDPPPIPFLAKDSSWGPEELSDKFDYEGVGLSTTVSENPASKEGLPELLQGLERGEELRPEEWVDTKGWLGVIHLYRSRSAFKLTLDLQGVEFNRSAKTRLSYFLAIRHYDSLSTIVSGLNSPISCVKHSFANLLETILDRFEGLGTNMVHYLLEKGVLQAVEQGLKEPGELEYQLCLACVIGKMSRKNGYVQRILALPSAYRVLRLLVGLLEKLTEAKMLVRLAECLHFLIYRYDGSPCPSLLASLHASGLSLALSLARSRLSSEASGADSLLQELQLLA